MKTILKPEKYFLFVFIWIIFVFFSFVPNGMTKATDEFLGKDMAIVMGKAKNCITITNHAFTLPDNTIMVTSSSKITDENGKTISLKKLKIPCKARIKFTRKTDESDIELVHLIVKEYLDGASDEWTIKGKFKHYPK